MLLLEALNRGLGERAKVAAHDALRVGVGFVLKKLLQPGHGLSPRAAPECFGETDPDHAHGSRGDRFSRQSRLLLQTRELIFERADLLLQRLDEG